MLMIKPYDLTGYSKKDRWCVPSAVSLLTGAPLTETTSKLATLCGKTYKELTGVYLEYAVLALKSYGYHAQPIDLMHRFRNTKCGPTLKRFMRERLTNEVVNPLLIEVDGHALVSHYGMLFDNGTPKGAPVDRFPKPNRLVKKAFLIQPAN